MFKKVLLLFFLGSLVFFKAQEETDLLSFPNPLEYDGTEFFLARAKQRSKTLFQQQYVPKDEKIESFNQILDFSYFNKEIEMELAVRQKVESVQAREEKDKYAKVNVTESPDGKEYIVDFVISEAPENRESYIEYNIYRFKSYDSNGEKSFLIMSYAKRIFGDLKYASKALMKERDKLMTAMIEFKIPEIKIIATQPTTK